MFSVGFVVCSTDMARQRLALNNPAAMALHFFLKTIRHPLTTKHIGGVIGWQKARIQELRDGLEDAEDNIEVLEAVLLVLDGAASIEAFRPEIQKRVQVILENPTPGV